MGFLVVSSSSVSFPFSFPEQQTKLQLLSQASAYPSTNLSTTAMALLSKVVHGDSRQLTVKGPFSSEPFPNAAVSGYLKVVDEGNSPWRFKYKVSGNKRILSYQWELFYQSNRVDDGDEVAIHKNDGLGSQADYKIKVIRRVSN